VPYHALDAYLAKLIRAGHKWPSVTRWRIPSSPKAGKEGDHPRSYAGTIIEPSMLDEASNNFLAAVVENGIE